MTESKTETSEMEENTEGPDQGTIARLGENKEFLEDRTTTTATVETEEITTDPYYYDFPHTVYPMYVLPVDYSYYSDTDKDSDKTELYDLPEQPPTEFSTPAEESETDAKEDEIVSNSQDVDSEEASGTNPGPELSSKENSVVDHNDPSKLSHRLTNGTEPSKTIESDGKKMKKTIEKPLMAMVRQPKNIQW